MEFAIIHRMTPANVALRHLELKFQDQNVETSTSRKLRELAQNA